MSVFSDQEAISVPLLRNAPPLSFLPSNSLWSVICHVQNLQFFLIPLVFGSLSGTTFPLARKMS